MNTNIIKIVLAFTLSQDERGENFHYFPSICHDPFFPHTIKKIHPEVNRGYISSYNQDKIVLDKFFINQSRFTQSGKPRGKPSKKTIRKPV